MGRRVNRLSDEAHAEGGADSGNGLEAWCAVGPQSFVEGFARDAGGFGDLGHAASAGDLAQRRCEQSGVVRFEDVGEVSGDGGLAVEVGRGPELGDPAYALVDGLACKRNGRRMIRVSANSLTERPMDARFAFPGWPRFGEEDVEAAARVLRSGKVNYWTGEEGRRFEEEFARFAGCRYAVAVANGTVALELALRALGVEPGDEVVTTCRSFIASASCVVAVGARVVFADVDRESGNVTAETVRVVLTAKTKALIVVHLAGWPCEMDAILKLAREHGLAVVEDCAQAHGATYKGRPVGSMGDVGAFSFCQDKSMTTAGEGGMVTTQREDLWRWMWAYKDHGKSFKTACETEHPPGYRWLHESFGTNWRLSEVQSAVGRVALARLPEWLRTRRSHAALLTERLSRIAGLRVPVARSYVEHGFYRFYAYLRPEMLAGGWSRGRILEAIVAAGVPCGSGSCSEVYLEKAFPVEMRPPERLGVARELGETSLAFLVHPTLERRHIERMCEVVEQVMSRAVGSSFELGEPVPVEPLRDDERALGGRVVMVTGAAGSIGAELCRQIVRANPKRLICLDRAETPLFDLQRRGLGEDGLGEDGVEVVYAVADIADATSMRHQLRKHGVETIFHAAAYKHVPMTEANPYAALKNNVFGLEDLVEAAESCGCKEFVLISSDKAVNPSSLMGCTKRIGEMILGSRPSRMRCVSVRFGNVLGSQGSVVPLFQEQIREGKPITVTHPGMMRYFMTIPEAASLVLQALTVGEHGDILVLDMGEPVRIVDLAHALAHQMTRAMGKREDEARIVYTGVRPGEKLREELFYSDEIQLPTGIGKVSRAQGRLPRWTELTTQLRELRGIAQEQDGDAIRAKMKQIVPEYAWEPGTVRAETSLVESAS